MPDDYEHKGAKQHPPDRLSRPGAIQHHIGIRPGSTAYGFLEGLGLLPATRIPYVGNTRCLDDDDTCKNWRKSIPLIPNPAQLRLCSIKSPNSHTEIFLEGFWLEYQGDWTLAIPTDSFV